MQKEKESPAPQNARYLVTFELPADIRKSCSALETALHSQLGIVSPSSVGPHITIKPPFSVEHIRPKRRRRSVEGVMEKMAAGKAFKSPTATIWKLDSFDLSEGKVLHLALPEEQNKELYSLARYVIANLNSYGIPSGEYDGKRLHITLARRLNEETFGGAWELASERAPIGTMTLNAIILHEKIGGGAWVPIARYPLAHRS